MMGKGVEQKVIEKSAAGASGAASVRGRSRAANHKIFIQIVVVLLCIAAAVVLFPRHRKVSISDFAAYWTGSRLLISRQNPYNPAAVTAMERPFGVNVMNPLILRNPPWVLTVVLPVGLVSYQTGRVLWLVLQLILTIWSIRILWTLYGEGSIFPSIGWVAVALFTPIYAVLAVGQITPMVLLGIAGFLYAERSRRDGLAGLSLFLAALKPHLLFLMWPALVVWVIARKRWRLAFSFAGVLAVASALPLIWDKRVFQHYFELWQVSPVMWDKTSNLSGTICRLAGSGVFTAFSLTVAALIWLGYVGLRNREKWDWLKMAPPLILISIVASPYGWFFDQIVMLPGLIECVVNRKGWRRANVAFLFALYLCVNLVVVWFAAARKESLWYSWTAAAWLVIYLAWRIATRAFAGRTMVPQSISKTW